MTQDQVLQNIADNCIDDQTQHEEERTTEQWIDALTDRLTLLSEAMQPKSDPAGKPHPSRYAAQVGGLCLRLILEKGWPLIPPDVCADVEV